MNTKCTCSTTQKGQLQASWKAYTNWKGYSFHRCQKLKRQAFNRNIYVNSLVFTGQAGADANIMKGQLLTKQKIIYNNLVYQVCKFSCGPATHLIHGSLSHQTSRDSKHYSEDKTRSQAAFKKGMCCLHWGSQKLGYKNTPKSLPGTMAKGRAAFRDFVAAPASKLMLMLT